MSESKSYAIDGRCHNAELGTYGHECGKPAVWVGFKISAFSPDDMFASGYCDDCKRNGYEARSVKEWRKL